MRSFENYIERIQSIETLDELKSEYTRTIAARGYENCIVTSVRPGHTRHHAWFKSHTGKEKVEVERRWAAIAPLLRHPRNALRPILWDNPAPGREGTGGSQDNTPKNAGHVGLAFPMRVSCQQLDVMSVAKCPSASVAPHNPLLLQAISDQTWARHQELVDDPSTRPADSPLTARELEILHWCKHGKTYAEISEILAISKKTVEFHVSNVMDKLGANNKVSAIVIAIQKGLIEL